MNKITEFVYVPSVGTGVVLERFSTCVLVQFANGKLAWCANNEIMGRV